NRHRLASNAPWQAAQCISATVAQDQSDSAARLVRAAAFVRPCPFAPGTSAQYATNHLPSRSIIAVTSFRMAPLYRARALATWPSTGEVELDACRRVQREASAQ